MPNLIVLICGVIGAAGVFVVFLGLASGRRQTEGSDEMQTRLMQYGVGAPAQDSIQKAPPASMRERVSRLFEPIARRTGQGNVKKGKKPLA